MRIRRGTYGLNPIDKVLLFSAVALVALSLVFMHSATSDRNDPYAVSDMFIKQAVWGMVGIAFMLLMSRIDYMRFVNIAYVLYAIALGMLVLIFLIGSSRYGAKRWIALGPISLQPSEFVKIGVILALAAFMGDRREKIGTLSNFLMAVLLVSPAFLLIFAQPDLGTALILMPILFGVMFICGENVKYTIVTFSLGLMCLPVFWHILRDYQKSRLLVFINPNLDPLGAGYTIIQSKIAVGSGGFLGKGWLGGTQSQLKFLPEKHTDFIFSTIGEEWGFIGGMLLVTLYAVIVARAISLINEAGDIYAKAIAAGIATLLAFQVFTNIAMTIGMMPVVGIPLPAISYGGSNTVTTLIGLGLLMSVARRARR